MSNFYNTTAEQGPTLEEYRGKARTQDQRILEYFAARPQAERSPSQVQAELGMQGVPLTSIRRAMSSLTRDGKLTKTTHKVDGPYGRPEYCWRLATGQMRLI